MSDKFDSLTIHDYLDENMLRVATAITKAGFLFSDYSCGGHLDGKRENEECGTEYRVNNANRVYIGMKIKLGDSRSLEFTNGLDSVVRKYNPKIHKRDTQVSITYEFIERGNPDPKTEGHFSPYYISEGKALSKEQEVKRFLAELAIYIESFLSDGEKVRQVSRTKNEMVGFLLSGYHDI